MVDHVERAMEAELAARRAHSLIGEAPCHISPARSVARTRSSSKGDACGRSRYPPARRKGEASHTGLDKPPRPQREAAIADPRAVRKMRPGRTDIIIVQKGRVPGGRIQHVAVPLDAERMTRSSGAPARSCSMKREYSAASRSAECAAIRRACPPAAAGRSGTSFAEAQPDAATAPEPARWLARRHS
jgi:hypothetical protein